MRLGGFFSFKLGVAVPFSLPPAKLVSAIPASRAVSFSVLYPKVGSSWCLTLR